MRESMLLVAKHFAPQANDSSPSTPLIISANARVRRAKSLFEFECAFGLIFSMQHEMLLINPNTYNEGEKLWLCRKLGLFS